MELVGGKDEMCSYKHTHNSAVHTMGLSREVVKKAITNHLPNVVDDIAVGASKRFTISVGEKNIVYSAYKFSDGSINVGRITATGAKVK